MIANFPDWYWKILWTYFWTCLGADGCDFDVVLRRLSFPSVLPSLGRGERLLGSHLRLRHRNQLSRVFPRHASYWKKCESVTVSRARKYLFSSSSLKRLIIFYIYNTRFTDNDKIVWDKSAYFKPALYIEIKNCEVSNEVLALEWNIVMRLLPVLNQF
jgi:hypothetical protein